MLQTIRDRMSGPIVWGIIGFLVLLFAVWGIGVQSFIGGGGDPTVAKVGDIKITQAQYQAAYDRAYQQLVQMMGDKFSPDKIDMPRFRQRVLDQMIRTTLQDQYAKRAGYATSDQALYDYLATIPQFQDQGHFSASTYRKTLADNGMTPEQFENQVRDSLRVDQLRNMVLDTATIVPKQAQIAWTVSHQSRDFTSVVFDPSSFAKDVTVTDAEVQARYQRDKAKYVAPLKVKLAYVELNQDQLAPATPPSRDVLKAIYDAQKNSRFTVPEERKAQHILIPFGSDPQAAHKKIEQIAAQLKAGANFAKLAEKDSQDPGSKNKGGDLGWVKPGMMDPAFEKALFALAKPGDISPPVKTKFGWHLIKLDEVRAGRTLPFDDAQVQKQLLDTFNSKESAKRFKDDADKLSELAFENTASLDPVAKALGLQVQTTDWITRDGGSGIAADKPVLQAAFSSGVLKDGENSKPLQIGPADLVVIRKVDEQPSHPLSFDEVKDNIRAQLLVEAEAAKAQAAAKALLKQVLDGKQSLARAAMAAGVVATPLVGIRRDNSSLGKALLQGVFSLPQPTKDAPSVGIVPLDKGKIAVISVDAVHQPAAQPIGKETPAFVNAARQLNNSTAGAEFDAYREFMKHKIKVDLESAPKAAGPVGPDQ